MELYINSTWTKLYGNAYIAEAIACSEHGNHVTIYATGTTAEEADIQLMSGLRELRLIPEVSSLKGELDKVWQEEDLDGLSGAS
jgi:hypothetical protein